MLRTDSGYPDNFMVNSWVFKDDESESDAKTNSKHRVCLLVVGSPLLAWRVHIMSTPPSPTHTNIKQYFYFPLDSIVSSYKH